ncbi:MAG: dihydroorotate dehydrogenase [Candidatus Bathyarchaeota archaeon]|nr:MAG: dihydroorotate dehydrogenase [Candidatus Bathyarchaeota archaeon]
MANPLITQFAGLNLSNPTMLAAGVLGYTGLSMKRVIESGAGAVVTKSMGLEARTGYGNPTVVQTDCGLLNSMGLPNPGIRHFKEEIQELNKLAAPTIFSIYGFSPEDFAEVAQIAVDLGAAAVELNVSCPHVKKAGAQVGSDPSLLMDIVKHVKKQVNKPVIVKLTPNVTDITEIAKASEKAGADAVCAINTVKAMAIDSETCRPILANKYGGLSGPAIKSIGVRCVYDIFDSVKIPIIGCGGISNWQDAIEYMLAGACAVQIGTAIAFQDITVFKSVTEGMTKYLEEKGYNSIKEIVGLAHKF